MRKLLFCLLLLSSTVFSATKDAKVDKILILKSARKLQLLRGKDVVKEYRVALGKSPAGAKERQGDGKTPEGSYVIDYRNKNSQFHRSLHISYPNATDKTRARILGVDPGGDVFIHGLMNGYGWIGAAHRTKDWTLGCIAVTNEEIEEIWKLVPDGTPVEIRP
jgi:murein L,D-transpeptidase YafK